MEVEFESMVPEEAARQLGMKLTLISQDHWKVEPCWCLVTLAKDNLGGGKIRWRVSRFARANRTRRWKTVYKGPRLETALRTADRWRDPEK